MRILMTSLAALALVACNKPADTAAANAAADTNVMADADAMADANAAMIPAAFTIKSTSWEYMDSKAKKMVQESVDADGNYTTWAGTEHIDHGTAVDKDGKACFTSAMNKDGETCWTDPKIEVGASGETVSDKGEKLPIKRIAYVVAPAMK